MSVVASDEVEIRSEPDVVQARQRVRALATTLRFSLVDLTKLVTAASEIARNTLIHGGGGVMRAEAIDEPGRTGIRMVFEDSGPGIANLDDALTDGWTSGSGLGMGLPGTRRLVSEFDIETGPGGTRVTLARWR